MRIRNLQGDIHEENVRKGWWETDEDKSIPTKLALIHSEVSEALEEYREDRMKIWFHSVEENNKPEGFGIELADTLIRILDLAEYLGIDMEECIGTKMRYNATRPYRHGGKKI